MMGSTDFRNQIRAAMHAHRYRLLALFLLMAATGPSFAQPVVTKAD